MSPAQLSDLGLQSLAVWCALASILACNGQSQPKLCAAFRAVGGRDQAVVRDDHLLHDRQAQSRPVRLRRRKRLEQLAEILRRKARAVVFDHDVRFVVEDNGPGFTAEYLGKL